MVSADDIGSSFEEFLDRVYEKRRVYAFSNQWTYEKTIYLLPSISISLIDYCLDISFLWFKFSTFIDFTVEK